MADHAPRPPRTGTAFDDPATRKAWTAAYRRIKRRLWLWTALFAAALAVSAVLASWQPPVDRVAYRGRNNSGPAGLVGGPAVLAYLFALYACRGALARLRRARAVLEVYPWRAVPAVRRVTGTKEPQGVPVQFRLPDGEGPDSAEQPYGEQPYGERAYAEDAYVDDDGSVWSRTMAARNPLRWNRWDTSMTHGAWYAGDPERGGVLALPGGDGLMTVQRRARVLTMAQETAGTDHAQILAAAPGRN